MPKARYAERNANRHVKKRKLTGVIGGHRLAKLKSKRVKAGTFGTVSEYVGRTRAIKRLQLSIADFRRLCILKGIYPRDPKNKKHLDSKQTYYHHKDIMFLAHEPLLRKFNEQLAFSRKLKRAIGRFEMDTARRMYETRPMYTLDHLIKERYPRFGDALGDLDDALSMLHLFASFPAEPPIKADITAMAKRLCREWQYYCARSRSLRKVFFSIKGVYYQAEVGGVTVTWLQPWQFSQALPCDVDYKVMLTFLELHEVLVKFTLFKLYHGLGLSYPPKLRAEMEDSGANLAAVEVSREGKEEEGSGSGSGSGAGVKGGKKEGSGSGSGSGSGGAAEDPVAAARLASLATALATITSMEGGTAKEEDEEGGGKGSKAKGGRGGKGGKSFMPPTFSTSLYDFVEGEEGESGSSGAGAGAGASGASASESAELEATMVDMAEFSESSAEAKHTLEKAKALKAFQALFSGLVFFLGREVPRDVFEFLVCSFRGRVGWDGVGSPYAPTDQRITHHVWDRPSPPTQRVPGREYVAPQWVADSVNARVLLPVAKYAPSASLPPHLSPFVDDAAEGYIPAYRGELDALRSAAAVTGKLADLIVAATKEGGGGGKVRSSRVGGDAGEEEEEEEGEEGGGDGGEMLDDEEEEEEGEGEGEEEEEDGEEGGAIEDDGEEEEDVEEMMEKAMSGKSGSKRGRSKEEGGARKGLAASALEEKEEERRAMASAMLSKTQKKMYVKALAEKQGKSGTISSLVAKRATLAASGDSGVGKAAAPITAGATAGGGGKDKPQQQKPAKQQDKQQQEKPANPAPSKKQKRK